MFSPKSVLPLLFLFVFLLSAATADTQISFPSFSPESNGDFFTFGDVAYDLVNRSYIINEGAKTPASKGSCGTMVYGKPVRIQNAATGSVASFSTSFSFTFTTHGLPWDNRNNPLDGSWLSFAFVGKVPMTTMHDVVSQVGAFGACTSFRSNTHALTPTGFHVRFDTDYCPINRKEPSNNFIRVGRNLPHEYDVEAYTHNLCGNETHCTYLSNGRTFTAWIDFESSPQTLEVRMANGSNAKPLKPLLLISNFEFPKSLAGEVLVTFWGSSDVNHREEHELLSWSFFNTEISESKLHMMLHYWKSRTGVGITTGVLVGTMAALVILWSIYSFATPSTSHGALGYSQGPRVFSYKELRKATKNFGERNLLGRGGSGLVYKGSLEGGGVLVAVKQINMSESKHAESLFHAEVESLGQIRHRNVVQLHGWCQEKGKLLLVYEYMSNGTLNHWLHGSNNSQQVLSLKMRHSILEGVGAALEYLHEGCSSCILHRDIKSSNVLLDGDFKAYVGDFGLARLMDHHQLNKTTLAAGTFGYMAPELPYTGRATKESDVYSFGILVLEVVCGRRPLDLQMVEPEDLVLLFKVWRAHEGGSLFRLADPRMFAKAFQPSSESLPRLFDETTCTTQVLSLGSSNFYNLNCSTTPTSIDVDVDLEIQKAMVVSLLQLGLFCCLPNSKARPSMGEVNRLLQQIQEIGDVSSIMTIPMPTLPDTKPPGVYHSLELSQSVVLSTLVAPSPTSLV